MEIFNQFVLYAKLFDHNTVHNTKKVLRIMIHYLDVRLVKAKVWLLNDTQNIILIFFNESYNAVKLHNEERPRIASVLSFHLKQWNIFESLLPVTW